MILQIDQVAFSLLLNSICSFVAGLMIVFFGLKIFRVDNSRFKLFLLTLPFIKILWDIFYGIPSTSFMFQNMDPFTLPAKHKYLSIGAGFSSYLFPIINLTLSVKDVAENMYSITAVDFLYVWLVHHNYALLPKILLLSLLGCSLCFLIYRFYNFIKFEIHRRKIRSSPTTQALQVKSLKYRTIDIYTSDQYTGTPFTGGVLRPFICFPKKSYDLFTADERESVIQHEIAHIKNFDLIVTLFVKILGTIFWFVPGYRWLSRKIDHLREILADQTAVQNGALAPALASALVKLKECEIDLRHAVLYSAFFREKSLLKTRVETLLGEEATQQHPRLGWQHKYIRYFLFLWIAGGVMSATFAGNHEIHKIPEWAEKMLKGWGLM